MIDEEPKIKHRCEGCEYKRLIHANMEWSFYGCTHIPYRGKWVAEIKECPRLRGAK